MSDLALLTFVSNPDEFDAGQDTTVVRIPAGISDRQDLFDVLANQLKFPYFGRNWDALEESLGDLSWIKTRKIVIIHKNLPMQLGEKALKTYLEILRDTIRFWDTRGEHKVVVVFPSSSSERIQKILQ